jgi:hypothetical protein
VVAAVEEIEPEVALAVRLEATLLKHFSAIPRRMKPVECFGRAQQSG